MIIQSKRVWINKMFTPAQIEVKDGRIEQIFPYGLKEADRDYGNDRILPGMIDVHCHGAYGFDTMDAEKEGLQRWADEIAKEGITSFLATTETYDHDVLIKAAENVAEYMKEEHSGAQVIGLHFEGPFINKKNKGAQPEQYCRKPDLDEFKQFQEAAGGNIRLMTVACELDENFEVTRYCAEHGVAVSIGHSAATYEEAVLACANGARSVTHTYNGQTGLHHREPGVVGAAMRNKDIYAEIITDGNHVTFPAIYDLVMHKQDKAIMITDSLRCKGLPKGQYEFGGFAIEIRDNGSCYITGTNTLAGSTLKFNEGLRNLIEKVQLPLDIAIPMTSSNAAEMLRIADRKGYIKATLDADFVVIDDDYQVVQTYIAGKEVL